MLVEEPANFHPADLGTESCRPVLLNDRHSQLNTTRVHSVPCPRSLGALIGLVRQAQRSGQSISICGNRHAMGGQQLGRDTIAIDMRGLDRVLDLDTARGIVEVEAGITWPQLLEFLNATRSNHGAAGGVHGWAIRQKQTGADELTLGGALAANVHGRGLTKSPIIEDIESFRFVDAGGQVMTCSREQNTDLFRLVIGGYGLFGIVYAVRLRLAPRRKMRRTVDVIDVGSLVRRFDDRIASGFEFGDFQFQIDDRSDDFLTRGVFSCYQPVRDETPMPGDVPALQPGDWMDLLYLAHADKSRGFQLYTDHYARTDGAVYWSDFHQFTTYIDGYHESIDERLQSSCRGSEMITELYVPRSDLVRFLAKARSDLRRLNASVIYGTVRLIERDTESFLAWAREPWACVIFNLCVEHSDRGLRKAKKTFQQLIDRAIELGGSYYLTYHRFARRDQVEACYPQFGKFLALKELVDPELRFQSDWWRHHASLFSG